MNEQYNSPENIISEQEVVEVLEARGIEDSQVKEKLAQYAEQCEKEVDAKADADPENPVASNRAHIECAIKLGVVYLKTQKYRAYGRESLEEIFSNAGPSETIQDLADQIAKLLEDYS